MKLPRLKLWSLCLVVAASAVAIKLAMMAGVILSFTTPLLFLGPLSGIVLDRHRGGTGVAGGIIAGTLSGVAIGAFMNIYLVYNLGLPFSWRDLTVSTTVFVLLEAFCGWRWGHTSRSWHWSMANRAAADPKGNGT